METIDHRLLMLKEIGIIGGGCACFLSGAIIHRLYTSDEEHKSPPNITDKIKDPET